MTVSTKVRDENLSSASEMKSMQKISVKPVIKEKINED